MRLAESFLSVYSNPSLPSRSRGKLILCVSAQDVQSSCTIQDLLYGRRAVVDVEDAVVDACTDPGTSENQEELSPRGVHKVIVTGHSNEKPCRYICDPCQVGLFSEGPLCSRGQYMRVYWRMCPRLGNGLT